MSLLVNDAADPVELLKRLVSLPSVNPMGRVVDPGIAYEHRVTEFLESVFRSERIPFERFEISEGRANLVAGIDCGSSVTVLLDAHQDTVPVDGMTVGPFDPRIDGDRLYGRGACDVKGGMASMLAAFVRIARDSHPLAVNVVLTLTVDEEATTTGINHLVTLWGERSGRSKLLRTAPDWAVIAEPTDQKIVVAHRGATRWKIRTRGRACHSSQPELGVNAIYRMGRVLAAVEEYAGQLTRDSQPHPLCGPATLSIGRIEGGVSVNTVPDWCEIEVDRRVIPGEDETRVIGELQAFLAKRLDFECEFDAPWLEGPALGDDHNQSLADALQHVVQAHGQDGALIGVPYGTHASRTARAGVPSVVYGPGSIAQAHTVDEWVSIGEVRTASKIYEDFCRHAAPV